MKTIIDFFEESVAKFSENPYLWEKFDKEFVPLTYKETKDKVYSMAAGLLSLGVKNDDTISLLSEGRMFWVISELAILYTGAINVPLSIKLDGSDLHFRIEHSLSSIIVVSGGQAHKIKSIKDRLPLVKKIIYLDQQEHYEENEMHVSTVMQLGDKYLGLSFL